MSLDRAFVEYPAVPFADLEASGFIKLGTAVVAQIDVVNHLELEGITPECSECDVICDLEVWGREAVETQLVYRVFCVCPQCGYALEI